MVRIIKNLVKSSKKERKEQKKMIKKNEKDIIIGLDTGFDATKIVINGLELKIPYNVVDITGQESSMMLGSGTEYILTHYLNGKNYLVGEEARKLLIESSYDESMASHQATLNSFDKFETDYFEIGMLTAIGVALIRYSEALKNEKEQHFDINDYSAYVRKDEGRNKELDKFYKNVNIYVGIALPNDIVDNAWEGVANKIAGVHSFDIELEGNNNFEVSFSIEKDCCTSLSQVRAAFLGLITDDDGAPLTTALVNPSKMPLLVLDGGYKTIGMFKLARNGSVVESESNTSFAMSNVNQKVAEAMKEDYNRADIKEYKVEELASEGSPIVYIPEGSDSTSTCSINKIRDEKIEETCGELISYIDDKFHNFIDVKSVIVTGGTGKVYFEQIKKFIEEKRQPTEIYLTDYEFNGEKVSPTFAIAVGMYKYTKLQVG